ncbi:MAG: ribonuclease activity regulator RraA [Rhodospirillaceae bacterium]|nr:ribonuclease activity regulator RraA [Rhodospirillaceae bacterium]|tara:strand:- start:7969 stop:8673 length:705 start_codon:yes stop_codon:yes gene_type:complete
MNKDVYTRLAKLSTATISTQLFKRGIRAVYMDGIAPLVPGQPTIAGPAFTMRCLPFREDLFDPEAFGDPKSSQRRMIEGAPEGSIVVIGARGSTAAAVIGDILATRLKVRGVAGLVTDGAVRDAAGVAASGLRVVCAGASAPANATAFSDGGLDLPIACGGVTVYPGDGIIADSDGAIVIPADLVADAVDGGEEQEKLEAWVLKQAESGTPIPGLYPPDDETLARYKGDTEGNA